MSSLLKEFCCVCVKEYPFLESINDEDENRIRYSQKLKTCLPSEIWYNEYKICKNCSEKLDQAYQFVHFCMKNKKHRLVAFESQKTTLSKLTALERPFVCCPCDKSFKTEKYLKQHNTKFHNGISQCIPEENLTKNEMRDLQQLESFSLEDKEEIKDEKELIECYTRFTDKIPEENSDEEIQNRTPQNSDTEDCDHNNVNSNCDISSQSSCDTPQPPPKRRKKRVVRKRTIKKDPKPARVRMQKKKGPFKCEHCSEVFRLTQFLVNHIRSKHTFEKPFACDECDAKYRNKGSLTLHKRVHTDERPYICTVCGKRYRSTADLNVHYETHSTVRAYTCSECGKAYKTNSNLRMHRLSAHVKPEDYKFQCNVCGKKFAFNANLEYHMKRHENVRNFTCHICENKFLFKHDLEKHLLTHGNDKPHICDLCKREYKSRHGWRKHMKVAHNLGTWRPPKIPERRHMCSYCPKAFLYNNKLQRHLLIHTGERPFKCEYCMKAFKDRYGLNVHIKNDHPDVVL